LYCSVVLSLAIEPLKFTEMRYFSPGPILIIAALCGSLAFAQDEAVKDDNAAEASAAGESIQKHPLKKVAPAEPRLTVREAMLESIADQLSRRMQALREREKALAAREKSILKREEVATEREGVLNSMEDLMQTREDVVKRREKLPPPQAWKGGVKPSVYGRYAAVLDGKTMQFFYKKSAHSRTPVASTQKLVTALVVCSGGDLDQMLTVPEEVLRIEPTLVGVKPGETYTRRQLLTALLVKSGNDLAATLAIDNAGSVEAFAEKMNIYARYIGMTDSNFINPHGLPATGQYSTARDIALAAFEAYQNPDICEMVKMRTYEFVFNSGSTKTLYNTNRVLSSFEGCNGMKTGFTYAAGNCLVSSASVNGEDRISVVIKSARPQVWEDSKKLLEWSLNLEMTGPLKDDAGWRYSPDDPALVDATASAL
jgi:D-alanyl-D-alanine carboxypeptidase (penicillin-binding protein 5/6)